MLHNIVSCWSFNASVEVELVFDYNQDDVRK